MAAATAAKLELLESDVIYRNPLPGHQGVAITHPFVHPLSQTELIGTYKHGQAQCAVDNMDSYQPLDGRRPQLATRGALPGFTVRLQGHELRYRLTYGQWCCGKKYSLTTIP